MGDEATTHVVAAHLESASSDRPQHDGQAAGSGESQPSINLAQKSSLGGSAVANIFSRIDSPKKRAAVSHGPSTQGADAQASLAKSSNVGNGHAGVDGTPTATEAAGAPDVYEEDEGEAEGDGKPAAKRPKSKAKPKSKPPPLVLPQNRVRAIMREESEHGIATAESVALMTHAAKLMIQWLVEGFTGDFFSYDDLVARIKSNEQLEFLLEYVPERVAFGDVKAELAKARGEKPLDGEDEVDEDEDDEEESEEEEEDEEGEEEEQEDEEGDEEGEADDTTGSEEGEDDEEEDDDGGDGPCSGSGEAGDNDNTGEEEAEEEEGEGTGSEGDDVREESGESGESGDGDDQGGEQEDNTDEGE